MVRILPLRSGLAVLCVLSLSALPARAAHRAPCRGGRFLAVDPSGAPAGAALLTGAATGTPDALVIDAGRITVESTTGNCGPAQVKLHAAKGATLIVANWKGCADTGGRIKLRGRLVAHCTLLKGTLRIGHGRARKVRAKLSTCGDRIVDTGAGEECEPPSSATCDAQCHLLASLGTPPCRAGRVSCNGLCVDPRSDPSNCGACGTSCPTAPGASPRCTGGVCATVCRPGFGDCDGNPQNGCETDLTQDPHDCGACGAQCPTVPNAAAACKSSTCTTACLAGFGDCDGNPQNGCETDLTADVAHCGKCATACVGDASTTASCQGGTCQFVCINPAPGQVVCGKSCVDTSSDAGNCGGCRNRCPPGELCTNGQCACGGNLALCGSRCTDLGSDPANCSQCGHACPPGDSCDNGHCSCDAPKKVCSGICSDLTTDTTNCGQCGRVCALGDSCVLGKCVCPAGKVLCSGRCVNLNIDKQNCGKCGDICPPGDVCAAAECICPAGMDVCSGTCTNLDTDRNNCGRCGFICPGPPPPLLGGEICVLGDCICPTGFEVCSGLCINPQSDAKNCGTCGRVCTSGKTCIKGNCITP